MEIYDAILIDEAQDFSPSFLRLCYSLLKYPKRLVYAYDELQSLSGSSLPPPEEIFVHERGGTLSRTPSNETAGHGPRRDIVLEKCYRNSRPVLVTAHALGFGVYRTPPAGSDTGLIQMFENEQLWADVGYSNSSGRLRDGERVNLRRTTRTSARFLEDHSSIDDLIQFKVFDDDADQVAWLVRAIKRNLDHDDLRCDDIVVINPDPRTTRDKVGRMRRRLFELNVNTHLAGVDTDPDTFFHTSKDSVTFTGVHRAKGNEAGMVYIINGQDCHSSSWNLATLRNRLFTAITRSKAWIRVLGVGDGMRELLSEYDLLRGRDFELEFLYPNADQRSDFAWCIGT